LIMYGLDPRPILDLDLDLDQGSAKDQHSPYMINYFYRAYRSRYLMAWTGKERV